MSRAVLYPGPEYHEEIPEWIADYFTRRGVDCELDKSDASGAASLAVARAQRGALKLLLEMAGSARILPRGTHKSPISRASAIDWYKVRRGGTRRTEIGNLVHRAKYDGDRIAEGALCERLAAFVAFHPMYSKADVVIAVHTSGSLATALAREVAGELNVPFVPGRFLPASGGSIPTVKGLSPDDGRRVTAEEVALNSPSQIPSGATALLVDDVWSSGLTIQAYAQACQLRFGSQTVYAVVAACTDRNAPSGARDEF